MPTGLGENPIGAALDISVLRGRRDRGLALRDNYFLFRGGRFRGLLLFLNLGRRRQIRSIRGGYWSRGGRHTGARLLALPFVINERPACVVAGIKPAMNRFGTA